MTERTFDTTAPLPEPTGYEVLPTDIYVMKVTEAAIEEDKFAEANRDGTKPVKLVITWEIDRLTAEQQEAGIKVGEKVWQRINPFYGLVKAGGPSKFKAFVDSLIEQGLLPQKFTTADLVGITQRVNVEEYTKTMGQNAGSQGNRVTAVASLTPKRRQAAPKAAPPMTEEQLDSIPF
jgi:hypothetical protein